MSVPADQATFDREALDPHCLSDEEADRLLAGAPWKRFLVVGDSIAEGLGDPSEGYRPLAWAQRVSRALERQNPGDFASLNLGLRDLVIAEVKTQQLGPAAEFKPDLALVIAGGNDILRPVFDNGDQVQADYDEIITTLKDTGADVLTCTMFDITQSSIVPPDYKAQLGERLGDLAGRLTAVAGKHGTMHVDFHTHEAAGDAGIYSKDVRHCNHRGHAIAASGAIRKLGEKLGNTL
jgi:lysophospholipase L1-like esterase